MKKKILIIGAGGHAKSCIDIIESSTNYKINFILGKKKEINNKILNYRVNLIEDNLKKIKGNQYGIVGIGQIKNSDRRVYFYKLLKSLKIKIPKIISKKSYVSKYTNIGDGTIVFHNSIVNADVKIGVNCIINSKSLIEHDVVINDHVHISTGANINGGCNIGDGSFIGSGAILKEGISIGKNCVVGSGVILKNNLNDNIIVR
jgi:sugar O-acyltransferase (sialic acid O-acetyltransferase NeuD family)